MSKIYILSRGEAIAAIGDGLIKDCAVISISAPNDSVPPIFKAFGLATFPFHFDDTTKDTNGWISPSQKDVEDVIKCAVLSDGTLAHETFVIHCAAGISRSSGMALAIRLAQIIRGSGLVDKRAIARIAISKVIDDAIKTHSMTFRDDASIHPNEKIVAILDKMFDMDNCLIERFSKDFNSSKEYMFELKYSL